MTAQPLNPIAFSALTDPFTSTRPRPSSNRVVRGDDRAALRARVDDLQRPADTELVQPFRVRDVYRKLLLFARRVDAEGAAREYGEREVMRGQ